MKVLLDEGVPKNVARHLPGHDVTTVPDEGWASVKNGRLLSMVETAGFQAFISNDKRLEFDQNLSRRPFAILLLSTNHWPTVRQNVGSIAAALDIAAIGTLTQVECGRFVPRRFREPGGPT